MVVFAGMHVQYAGPGGRVRVVAPVSQSVAQTVVLPVLPLVEVPHVVHRVHEQSEHRFTTVSSHFTNVLFSSFTLRPQPNTYKNSNFICLLFPVNVESELRDIHQSTLKS